MNGSVGAFLRGGGGRFGRAAAAAALLACCASSAAARSTFFSAGSVRKFEGGATSASGVWFLDELVAVYIHIFFIFKSTILLRARGIIHKV
jgi:hypothetical protein